MKLISSSGEIVDFCTSESIYTGGNSKIYEVDESKLLKVHLLLYGVSLSPLSTNVFDVLKTIKHENFINLIERYNRIPQTSENVEAYTYEHIKGDIYNPLYLRTDFVINQFRCIQNLFEIFSSEGIMVSDVDAVNSVVLKNRIVLIDPDFYQIYDNKEILLSLNKSNFVELMMSYFYPEFNDIKKIYRLFDGVKQEKDPVKTLAKRLKGYKLPIDYFIDK